MPLRRGIVPIASAREDDVSAPRSRRSLRLRHYDYSTAGAYFITICTEGRLSLFGCVVDERVELTPAGIAVKARWAELAERFPGVESDIHVIMPNHFHAVVVIAGSSEPPGRRALGDVIGWFKSTTTVDYVRGVRDQRWPPFERRLWQYNYFEHIVRNEGELGRIREYIATNPARWAEDSDNPVNVRDRSSDVAVIGEAGS